MSKKKKKAQKKRKKNHAKILQNHSPPVVVELHQETLPIEIVKDIPVIDEIDIETNYTKRFDNLIKLSPEAVTDKLLGMPTLDRRIMLSMLYFRSRGLDEHVWDILKYWKTHSSKEQSTEKDFITIKPSSPIESAQANT